MGAGLIERRAPEVDVLRDLPFDPELHFAEIPGAHDVILDSVVDHAEVLRVVVPVEGEIRLDRASSLRVREEVVRGRADAGADVPGTGSLNREVFGVDMFIGADPHADHLSLELEAGRVLRTARAHPVLQTKRVACFKRTGPAFRVILFFGRTARVELIP